MLPAFTQRASFWFALFTIWFCTLWFLSGRPLQGPKFPTTLPLDKIYHFGYFFGGAGLLSAALFLRAGDPFRWRSLHLTVLLALTFTGAVDEWHQSWFPYRSGNDLGDLTADVLGALAGTLVFRSVQQRFFPKG